MKTMETKKVNHVSRRFRRFRRANEAASALEYALVVAVVATGIAAALLTFGQAIEALWERLRTKSRKPKAPPTIDDG